MSPAASVCICLVAAASQALVSPAKCVSSPLLSPLSPHLHLRPSRPVHLSWLLRHTFCDSLSLNAAVRFPIRAVPLPDVPRILRTSPPPCSFKANEATTPSSSPFPHNPRTSSSSPLAMRMASMFSPSPSHTLSTPGACRRAPPQAWAVPVRSTAKRHARPHREGTST